MLGCKFYKLFAEHKLDIDVKKQIYGAITANPIID